MQLRFLYLSIALVALTACSIYQSDGRKRFEKDTLVSGMSLLGCQREESYQPQGLLVDRGFDYLITTEANIYTLSIFESDSILSCHYQPPQPAGAPHE